MLGEQVIAKSKEWVLAHRGLLLKVAAGVGAGAVGALLVRRHDQIRNGGFVVQEEAALRHAGLDLSPRRAGEFFAGPGRSTPGGKLTEYLSPDHTGCVALLAADKRGLVEHASRLGGKIAAACRKDEDPWTVSTISDDHPSAKPRSSDPANIQIGAFLRLDDGATEAALGAVITDEQSQEAFVPLETATLLGAGPAAAMGLTSVTEDGTAFYTIIPPGNDH